MDSLSFSNTISKQTVLENTSMTYASLEDAKKRENDAISNERIQNGDMILETYEVTSDAISGGMGSVWRVHHQSWNTDLAMKRPQPRFFAEGSEGRKEQFIKECENWINLGLHPNIVSCYYVREIGGVPTIFSEWMDGGSLKDRISDGTLYDGTEEEVQKRILDIAIQAARGLQYSHENGLIHQDMKPGNLLLSKNWDAKVADFGLAKAKEQLDDKSDTAKTTGYTLAYCPKEQSDGEEPQKWMDVYAWALTVFEMYAGKRLWETGAEAKERFDEYLSHCEHSIPDQMQILLKASLTEKTDRFSNDGITLEMIYRYVTSKDYSGTNYESLKDSADNINNRALSFLDLRQIDNAEKNWNDTLEHHPDHVESSINNILFRWYYNRFKGSRDLDHYAVFLLEKMDHDNDLNLSVTLLFIAILQCNRDKALGFLNRLERNGYDTVAYKELRNLIEEKCKEPNIVYHFDNDGTPIAASENCDIAVLDDMRSCVRIISAFSDEHKGDFRYTHNKVIDFASFNHKGDLIALCGDGGVTVWNVKKHIKLFSYEEHAVQSAYFDEENDRIAVHFREHDKDPWGEQIIAVNNGQMFSLPNGEAGNHFFSNNEYVVDEKTFQFFKEEEGKTKVVYLKTGSIAYCYQDKNGNTQYRTYLSSIREYGSKGAMLYRFKNSESRICVNVQKQFEKMLYLNSRYISVKTDNGFDIMQVSAPDLKCFPPMLLCRINSVNEQLQDKDKYDIFIKKAEELLESKDYKAALHFTDRIMELNNFKHDSKMLALRYKIGSYATGKTFANCIELTDFEETLPFANPATFPETNKKVNVDSFGYPIQKVYSTAYNEIYICCGWKHERKFVDWTSDFQRIKKDSSEYRLTLYDGIKRKETDFPPFASNSISGILSDDQGYHYSMYTAYNEEYHKLIAGNEDIGAADQQSFCTIWDTQTQKVVKEIKNTVCGMQQLSELRYVLVISGTSIMIIDLKDNSVVWSDVIKIENGAQYNNALRCDRQRDIYQIKLWDGTLSTKQIIWNYSFESDISPDKSCSDTQDESVELSTPPSSKSQREMFLSSTNSKSCDASKQLSLNRKKKEKGFFSKLFGKK